MIRTAEANVRKTSAALASELDELIQSASELLDSLNDQRGEAVQDLRTRATRNIDNARRRLAALKPQVVEGGAQAARAAVGFARNNPWSTVAIGAAVIGALAAVIYLSTSDD
jgi:ElaB/YqjD/DUF883 family membrane-anchored ribosome-binding protein